MLIRHDEITMTRLASIGKGAINLLSREGIASLAVGILLWSVFYRYTVRSDWYLPIVMIATAFIFGWYTSKKYNEVEFMRKFEDSLDKRLLGRRYDD
jgi:hypothetical protein